jgi:hypothetical protein
LLSDTLRGVMLSIRQPLTASPSVNLSGLAPFTAKIATWCPGAVTIPVSRASARSELATSLAPLGGGRRVLLNSGRARAMATNSSSRVLGCPRTVGAAPDRPETAAGAVFSVAVGLSSTKTIAPKTKHPASKR